MRHCSHCRAEGHTSRRCPLIHIPAPEARLANPRGAKIARGLIEARVSQIAESLLDVPEAEWQDTVLAAVREAGDTRRARLEVLMQRVQQVPLAPAMPRRVVH